MHNFEVHLPSLEEHWHQRVETARKRYETATTRYRKLLEEGSNGLIPRPDDPLVLARHDETEALAEYSRILKLFTDLNIYGRIPEEGLTAGGTGGRV